jgi:hypothetical protein
MNIHKEELKLENNSSSSWRFLYGILCAIMFYIWIFIMFPKFGFVTIFGIVIWFLLAVFLMGSSWYKVKSSIKMWWNNILFPLLIPLAYNYRQANKICSCPTCGKDIIVDSPMCPYCLSVLTWIHVRTERQYGYIGESTDAK